jgi:succinyl-diaminopimelate desuccinylase
MKDLLKKLIDAKPTAENGEAAAAKVLFGYFTAHRIESAVDTWGDNQGNCIAHIKSAGQKPALMFVSHLDVVPASEENWLTPPFEAVEKDGKIYGRGAADMKAGLAASAAAVAEIVTTQTPLKGDIIFAATAGEETDSAGVKRFIEQNASKLPELAGIIIPEPTEFEVVTAHRGILWLKITTVGKTAHGSAPHLGINAITKMNGLVDRLADFDIPHQRHRLLGGCSKSITQIKGGTAINVIPDRCEIDIDIRTLPGQDRQAIIGCFEKLFASLRASDPDFHADISIIRSIDAMVTDADCEFVKSFCRIVEVTETLAAGFTTDGPNLTSLGAPIVIFGPGLSHLCHKPDEYIDFAHIEKAKKYYMEIIRNFLV